MRKPDFCLCENKGAVTAKLISAFVFATRLPKSECSSFLLSSVAVQAGLC